MLRGRKDEADRCAWLEALPLWTWDAQLDRRQRAWHRFIDELNMYIANSKTALVPQKFVSTSGYRLGAAVNHVRNGEMLNGRDDENERRETLESLPNWSWNSRSNHGNLIKKKWLEPGYKQSLLKKRAEKNAIKKRQRLKELRAIALPFEPSRAKRVKGTHYHLPNGMIGRWTIRSYNICGPSVDPVTTGETSDSSDV
jgi:hypothetical protein